MSRLDQLVSLCVQHKKWFSPASKTETEVKMLDTDKDNSNFPCLPIKLWMLVGVSKFRLSPEKKADVDKKKKCAKRVGLIHNFHR